MFLPFGSHRHAIFAASLICTAIVSAGHASAQIAASQIFPFVDCIEPSPDLGYFIAHFGYADFNTAPSTIPESESNFFALNLSVVPPLNFSPGVHHSVKALRVPQIGYEIWLLDNHRATAYPPDPMLDQNTGAVTDAVLKLVTQGSYYCPASMSSAGCGGDITTSVSTTLGGIRRNIANGHFTQTVTVYNASNTNLNGVALALDNLSATATLTNSAGLTVCASPAGSSYVAVAATLNAGATASVNLDFTNSDTSSAITYTPRVLGAGSR